MNCSECEQLFDAYFDGQLSGSLRLEFDAHRLRCRHCQQTLAMLEAVGHVLVTDTDVPELRENFTDNVMKRIHVRDSIRPATVRYPFRRIAIVGAALVQAAAVFVFTFMWTRPAPAPAPVTPPAPVDIASVAPMQDPAARGVLDEIRSQFEDRLWETLYAGDQLTERMRGLACFLDVRLSPEVVRESEKVASNPIGIGGLFAPLPRPAESDDESAGAADDGYSL
jgi:hypothetical protein